MLFHRLVGGNRIGAAIKKKIWLEREFRPFDRQSREMFFLAATGYLFTNYEERLANGYYMEFGCYKARTMRYCWRHTQHNFNLTYVGFDSFQGLPDIQEIDYQPVWKKGALSMDEETFIRKVCAAGLPRERLVTVKGFYDDSLTEELAGRLLPRKASMIYIDCDLYTSTVPVLKFIRPFLQKGAVIALDDWNCFLADPDRGQRRAWREFREENPTLHFEPFVSGHGLMSFIYTGPTGHGGSQ